MTTHEDKTSISRLLLEQLSDEFDIAVVELKGTLDEPKKKAKELMDDIRDEARKSGDITIDNVRRFQYLLLYLVNEDAIKNKMDDIIAEYKKLGDGEADYAPLIKVAEAASDKPDQLRLVLIEMQSKSNEILLARKARLNLRSQLSHRNLQASAVMLGFLLVFALLGFGGDYANSTLLHVFIAGILGGTFSTQRRIVTSDIPFRLWTMYDSCAANALWMQAAYSQFAGGVGALIIYTFILSASTLIGINADWFPKFCETCIVGQTSCEPSKLCQSWAACFVNAYPTTLSHYATLLLFGFVSGFSERLAPDLLDRLTGKFDKVIK